MNRGMRILAAVVCLCALLAMPCATAEQAGGKASNITRKCTFKLSEGTKDKLIDGKAGSLWSYRHKQAYVGIKLPKDAQAGWLRVEWFFDPTAYDLIEYDDSMAEIRRRDQSCTFPNIYSLYELLPETRYIQLKLNARDQSIVNLQVYSAGTLPEDVQQWNPPVDKADIMFFSTHQDDELVFFGGAIPYYAVALQKPSVVVYMTNCARYRRAEALNALWKMGVRDYPDFINLEDSKVGSIEACIKLWGGKDKILSLVVERIRRYKPEVIIAQDLNGEYGHNQHKTTARCMKYAIDAAADPQQYPESAQKYGTWQVKKLYHHLYKENAIEMDWETPLDSLGGKTALEVAKIGMKEHSSQKGAYAVKSHGTYDNSKFGLYFTTVGEDVAKNDFLENIDPDASANYLAEHAGDIAARKAADEAEQAAAAEAAIAEPEVLEDEADEAGLEPEAAGEEDMDGEADPEVEAPAEPDAVDETSTEPDTADGAQAEPEGDALEDEPGEAWEAGSEAEDDNGDEAVDSGAATQPPAVAEPTTARERVGSALLPIALIGAGVAAIGVGCWYGWRAMGSRRRRHRRRRR